LTRFAFPRPARADRDRVQFFFFLEGFAMTIFEGPCGSTPPTRCSVGIIELITRDESRDMGFGVLYVAEGCGDSPGEADRFARAWLAQILGSLMDQPRSIFLARVIRRPARRRRRGCRRRSRPRCCASKRDLNARELAEAASGARVLPF